MADKYFGCLNIKLIEMEINGYIPREKEWKGTGEGGGEDRAPQNCLEPMTD